MSNILRTQCEDSRVAMVMDDLSCPHCVWIDGTKVKYARYYGGEWRVVGGTAVAYSSDDPISVSKNCVGINESGECFFAIMDGEDLKVCSWDGNEWTVETAWDGAGNRDVLAWSVAWAGFPTVAVFIRNNNNRSVCVLDKWSGSWGTPEEITVPAQDNDIVELKASKVFDMVYLFWNGKDFSTGESWIGHVAWGTESRTWLATPEKRVGMSEVDGDIVGIDFAVAYEGESSSSSESTELLTSSSSSSMSSSSWSSPSSESSSDSSTEAMSSSSGSSGSSQSTGLLMGGVGTGAIGTTFEVG